MELANRTVVVVGLGASGLAAVRFARERGARVCVNDARTVEALGAAADRARELGAELRVGHHDDAAFADADVIVLSPGVPPLSAVGRREAAGAHVVGEAELALGECRGRVVGITGTNGKSTVTTLVGEMCKAAGLQTFVGGNLGQPIFEALGTPAAMEGGVVVAELSSFQLERARDLHCDVAVLLNVTDDHLDRYASFAEYAAAKARIFAAQDEDDVAVVPDGDELCLSMARAGLATLWPYGGATGVVRRDGDRLVDSRGGISLPLGELGLRGLHNADNAAAAAVAARALGIADEHIVSVLRSFQGLPHRMVLVRTLDGVAYFDDSKATNVGATVAALDGLRDIDGKVVLVAGGVDKGGSYAPVRERLEAIGRAVVLIGAAAPLIRAALDGLDLPIVDAATMEDAVARARGLASSGDAVLLAPACASFDMFQGYAHRGRVFASAVAALPEVAV